MHALIKVARLSEFRLQATDGEIGRVSEIYFDDEDWVVRYFVVKTGRWLLGRRVLVPPAAVIGVDDQTSHLNVALTRDQVENSPPVDREQPVSREYERKFFAYYGWEPYWSGEPFFGAGPGTSPVAPIPADEEPEHPHLRSSEEVRGYRIHGRDGAFGHVADFVLDRQTWAVRYLEVDTDDWFERRSVLISPSWLQDVAWAEHAVHVSAAVETIRSAPVYDPFKYFSKTYARALAEHFLQAHEPAAPRGEKPGQGSTSGGDRP